MASCTRLLLRLVREDTVCRRFVTVPGVGAIVAVTYKTAIDDPARFRKSKDLGAYFGLTPSKYQSGEVDRTGRISKVGDVMVRTALFEAANAMLSRVTRFSALKAWALRVAKLREVKRAKMALARKLAVVLHRMWVDAADLRRIPDAVLDQLLAGADPKRVFDPNGLLADLKKALAGRVLNAEMDHHLAGEEPGNRRNGYGKKTVITDTGQIELEVPRDRHDRFDPQLIAKYQRRFPGFDEKIISMYARGMSTREIVGHLRDLYGIGCAALTHPSGDVGSGEAVG
jgi:hypothetical protein